MISAGNDSNNNNAMDTTTTEKQQQERNTSEHNNISNLVNGAELTKLVEEKDRIIAKQKRRIAELEKSLEESRDEVRMERRQIVSNQSLPLLICSNLIRSMIWSNK